MRRFIVTFQGEDADNFLEYLHAYVEGAPEAKIEVSEVTYTKAQQKAEEAVLSCLDDLSEGQAIEVLESAIRNLS